MLIFQKWVFILMFILIWKKPEDFVGPTKITGLTKYLKNNEGIYNKFNWILVYAGISKERN